MSDESPLPPSRPPDGRAYHHGDLRRALVQAGRALLEREGSAALSLRAVAREAGVSAAAPYHHFKDRAALLYAIAHDGNVALATTLGAAFDATEAGRERIIAVGVAYVEFALANPALYRLMFETTRLRDHLHDASEAEGQIPRLMAATFGAGFPARRTDMERHLAGIAGWAIYRGLAEVAQYRTLQPFKGLLGGDRAFLEAVLGRLDFSSESAPDHAVSAFVTRFAPSPTGRLHLGHAFSALTAFETARAEGGRCLLRIEDIDATRSRPAFEAGILEDLAWLGLAWERPVRRQSEHMADYAAALGRLRGAGLLYRCFRTRKEVMEAIASAPHGPTEPFRGGPLPPFEEEARLAADRPFAWRLSLDRARDALGAAWGGLDLVEEGEGPNGETGRLAARPEPHGDVILARKDVGVAYHLAVVVDDALQGVSHVVRGQDLFEAAHIQRLLQALLGLPAPRYRHHRLIPGPDGRRLAKRDGAESLQALRIEGVEPGAVRARLGFAP